MHLHHGPLRLFHDPLDILPGCFTDGLGLGPAQRQTPPVGREDRCQMMTETRSLDDERL